MSASRKRVLLMKVDDVFLPSSQALDSGEIPSGSSSDDPSSIAPIHPPSVETASPSTMFSRVLESFYPSAYEHPLLSLVSFPQQA